MRIVDHVGLSASTLDALTRLVAEFGTLQDVVRWALAGSPPFEIAEVVVQDEFTHDVVIAWSGGHYLVFDTT